ncbi:MAG: chemotaxis protein CheA [Melioribacteraceae bacterium]|nr:chemotaxis protein CheA [Melioribacteraceae bacterium]
MTDKINFPEFADEAFEEIKENIIKIRKILIEIEDKLENHSFNKNSINDLLISFHTIKGISGMIGIIELQSVAHSIENYFKFINSSECNITKEAFEKIIEGVQKLENMIEILQNDKDYFYSLVHSLDLNQFTKSIASIIEKSKNENELLNKKEEVVSENEEALKNKFVIHFTPSQELFSKGINVNSLKNEISKIGEILSSLPQKTTEGKVAFKFIVLTNKSLEELKNLIDYVSIEEEKKEVPVQKQTEPQKQEYSNKVSTSSTIVRVELNKLDDLMRMIGDLVINRSKLDQTIKTFQNEIPTYALRAFQETNQSMERQLRYLREGIMRVRLVPIGEVFDKMLFVVKDLIRKSNKQINMVILGKDTEIDKYVIDKIFDPLMHIVRNSVSHGIEYPDERISKGKTKEGLIELNAFTSGDTVIIEIKDDGKGINRDLVFRKAIEAGIISPNENQDDNTLLNILCHPGFSTKDSADLASGRGVGMSSVKNVITELGGTIDLETEPDKGTKWIIHIPLTLAIIDALIIQVENHLFAIPQPSVYEVIEVDKNEVNYLQNNEIINYRGMIIPLVYLSKLFKINGNKNSKLYALLIGQDKNKIGLVVDKIKTSREIVVHTITDPLIQSTGISGATELGDGKAVLIIDTQSIFRDIKLKIHLN